MRTASRFTRVAVAAGLVVTSGAAVFGITSFASAQSGETRIVAPAATEDSTVPSDASTKDRPRPLAVAAEALDMTEAELRARLEAGKSIADVAKEEGVDIDTVIDALAARFRDRITEMVNTPGLPREGRGHGGRGHGDGGPQGRGPGRVLGSEALVDLLDLTRDQIRERLMAGDSLATIATAQGVSVDEVKKVLIADMKSHLDEEVASGEHTQAEADAKLEKFTSNLDTLINATKPGLGRGWRGGAGHAPEAGAPSAEDTALTGI